MVVPVFYKVGPSHVRNQTGVYKQAFARYDNLKVAQHKMQVWKKALKEAANLAGYDSHTFRDESEMIQKIVKDVLHKLNDKCPSAELKGLIGIDDNCAHIELLLRDTKTIGIWGMGAIGKSTIAKTIFLKYSSHYEGSCFLENVREKSQNGGLDELRSKFLSRLLNEDVWIDTSTTFLEARLSRMKVFDVLDDVSTMEQLECLVGETFCFGLGSKILITTRDKHVLIRKEVDVIYKVKELEWYHSHKLFNLNAFNTSRPIMGYEELTEMVVVYAKGIPLALKVLGSYLRGRSEVEWKSALRKLEKSPHEDIQKVLRLSYDGLNDEEKKIFLDIACFLKGELTEFVISLLDSFGFYGAIGIRTLHDKALIDVDDGMHLIMHDLIQEMCLQIAREESIDEPGKHSRLFDFEEIYDVLSYNTGSNKVECIKLDVSQIRDLYMEADIFKKMSNIRYLKFYSAFNHGSSHVHLPEGLKFLPNKMRYLEWYGFPHKSLPSTFCAEKLVKLSMPNSHLQKLWNGVQDLANLQEIDLSGSFQLQELPNLSKCLNLKVADLSECQSLCYGHSSILSLHSLVELNLSGCQKIRRLKSEFHLRSLQRINLNHCWNLKEFSLSSDELRKLVLVTTGIKILHSPVGRSSKLEELDLSGRRFMDLPNQLSRLTSLRILRLSKCETIDGSKLHILFDGMLCLREVELDDCCNIIELPNNTKQLLVLESLSVWNCRRLRYLPQLPPSIARLDAENCKSLEFVSTCRPLSGGPKHLSFMNCVQLNEQSLHNIMEAAYYSVSHKNMNGIYRSSIYVPGSKVPKWFKYRAAESSVIVELPQISGLADFFFCIVIGFYSEIASDIFLQCKCYLEGFEATKSRRKLRTLKMKSDHVLIWNDAYEHEGLMREFRSGNLQLFANMKLFSEFAVGTHELSKVMIKECGVCPVYISQRFVRQMELERKKKRPQDVEEQAALVQYKKFKYDEMDTLL